MSAFSDFVNAASDLTSYKKLAGNYIVSGIETDGIDGFTFSMAKEHEVSLSSSITDYPVEDGNLAQNVITLNPEKVKLTGVVAEVVYGPSLVTQLLDTVSASLLPVASLSPSLAVATQEIKSKLGAQLGEMAQLEAQLSGIKNGIAGAAALFGANSDKELNMTLQEKAYYYLELCWKSRKLLQIETPWRYFEDMAIEDLKFTQSETSNTYSDIEVTFKRIITPQARQTEQTKTRQGRARTGISEIVESAIGGGTKLVEATGSLFSEAAEKIGLPLASMETQIVTINDIMAARGDLE